MYDNLLAGVPTDLWIGGKWKKSSDGARFDVIDPAMRPAILKGTFAEGMLLLPSGARTLRLRPSLITTIKEIEQAVEILAKAVRQAAGKPLATV